MANYFWILFLVSFGATVCGLLRHTYYFSLGLGLSVSGAAVALFVPMMTGRWEMTLPGMILLCSLFLFGMRHVHTVMIMELGSKKNHLPSAFSCKCSLPLILRPILWILCALIITCAVSPVYFRFQNGIPSTACLWEGCITCAFAVVIIWEADIEKAFQKRKHPNMAAMNGLFRLVRYPQYLGEILFWTGVMIACLDAMHGFWQKALLAGAYMVELNSMFGSVHRMDMLQKKLYGMKLEYQKYVQRTPIVLPFVPLYHIRREN